uniref:LamG-like jellyroll fold domain-containing protein n=1 Tax=Tetraselmis sp. GSL018 TaxID=582737 RepID=A0A061RNA4_9CHLO
MAKAGVLPLKLCVIWYLLALAAGTHFRYGVLRWWVGPDSLAGVLDEYGKPVFQAVFEVKGAWRRDYSWGALFNEQWRTAEASPWRGALEADGDFDCKTAFDTNDPLQSGIQCFEAGNVRLESAQDYLNYQIKFITGVGYEGLPLPPRERQCVSPLHKGAISTYDAGRYGGPGPTLGELDPTLDEGYWGVSDGNENRLTETTVDDFETDFGTMLPLVNISESGVCAPWAESFGFFFGDGEYSDEIVVSVTDIDFETGLVGNYIRATSAPIVHNYSAAYDTSDPGRPKPWVAYWTAGNRLSELRNNADGRFRLEADVRFLMRSRPRFLNSEGLMEYVVVNNRSPIVAQIPVLPVMYPESGIARFQIPAYDPDFGDRRDQVRFFIGNPQEHGYILANYVRYRDHPGGPIKEEATYWEDVYHLRICEQEVGAPEVCNNTDVVGPNQVVVFGLNYTGNSNLTAQGTADAPLYPMWDPLVNIARAPTNLDGTLISIGALNGVVEWEVGRDPQRGKPPGFYQLTVMVEERLEHSFWNSSIDRDQVFLENYLELNGNYYAGYDLETGKDVQITPDGPVLLDEPARRAGARVPVDFMLYLYPAMHYCSNNCDRASNGEIMQTFESEHGIYGDPIEHPRSGDGLEGPGTGTCKICGGGGRYTHIPGDSGMVYYPVEKDARTHCRVLPNPSAHSILTDYIPEDILVFDNLTEVGEWRPTFGTIAWKDYTDPCNIQVEDFTRGLECLESGECGNKWVFQGCIGVTWLENERGRRPEVIVPYEGLLDPCQINHAPRFITDCSCNEQEKRGGNFTPSMRGCTYKFQGDVLERVIIDDLDCCDNPTAALTNASLVDPPNAFYLGMFTPGTVQGTLGQDLYFDLVATDDDQCVELMISDTGLPSQYMHLGPHIRLHERVVMRRFYFNPPEFVNGSATLDPREMFTRVCFYASDKYLVTSYPLHCLNIELTLPVAVKWGDEIGEDGFLAPQPVSSSLHTAETYKLIRSYVSEPVNIPMCVYKSISPNVQHNLAIIPVTEEHPGVWPNLYNFTFPVNSINFPPGPPNQPVTRSIAPVKNPGWRFVPTIGSDGKPILSSDPFYQTWTFTPNEYQECTYTVCFRGLDLESADRDDPSMTPTQYTSVRCYRVEVYNTVLEFAQQTEAEVPGLSELVTIDEGFSMSAWVFPRCICSGTNMTVMYFGSDRAFPTEQGYYVEDSGLQLRNGIKWQQTSESVGRFYYEDWRVGIKASPPQYACDLWHFVALTVEEDNRAVLYVDAERPTRFDPYSQEVSLSTQLEFTTISRPDTSDDCEEGQSGTGRFILGRHRRHDSEDSTDMIGFIDDVYVWNRALLPEEVGTVMITRTLHGNDPIQRRLLAWFPMRDFTGNASLPLPDRSGNEVLLQITEIVGVGLPPRVTISATPVVIPCVLGMEMPVGPTDGLCTQSVYGWNFANGPFLFVKFGDMLVRASYVDDRELEVDTPGHVSPRFVTVTASNNGHVFTNVTGAGRETQFLYLDPGLYMDGAGGGGQADSVCTTIQNRSVTFGAWVCPDCGQPLVHYEAFDPGHPNPKPKPWPKPAPDQVLQPLEELGLSARQDLHPRND